jgi:hypothetical protein
VEGDWARQEFGKAVGSPEVRAMDPPLQAQAYGSLQCASTPSPLSSWQCKAARPPENWRPRACARHAAPAVLGLCAVVGESIACTGAPARE